MSFLSYLGGSNLNTFSRRIAKQNQHGVKVSASKLPRTLTKQSDINNEIASYSRLIDMIVERKLDADVTIKLHQFGFYAGAEICTESVRRIVSYAEQRGIFIWLDAMLHDEVSFRMALANEINHFDDVNSIVQLDAMVYEEFLFRMTLFTQIHHEFDNVGVAVQAYHKDANQHITELITKGVKNIRLVKGIYADSQFGAWADVTANYKNILTDHLGAVDRFAIATHDTDLIMYTKTLTVERNCKDKIEFQHMAGVNDPQITALANEGYVTRVYMPYGNAITYLLDDWRRLDWARGFQRALGRKTIH